MICDVNKPMDPIGVAQALTAMKAEPEAPQPVQILDTPPASIPGTSPGDDSSLFDDTVPVAPESGEQTTPTLPMPTLPGGRPSLDAPTPGTLAPAVNATVS